MLYSSHTTEAQTVCIPKDGKTPSGPLTFRAFSTVDNAVQFEQQVIDLGIWDTFYAIAVEFSDAVQSGEYVYLLTDPSGTLSKGLMIVGEPSGAATQYEKSVEYEQYEL